MELRKAIVSGVIWNSIQEVITRSSGFFIKLFLARLLFPADFGIIGMAAVFIAFVQVFNDVGMNAALIQRKDELLNEDHYNTSFWTGVIWSSFIFLLIYFLLAPFVADFYGEPQLVSIVRVLSISVLLSPIASIQKAMLTKSFNFKRLSYINSSTSIVAGIISVILAYLGFGVWALVFNVVAPVVLNIPLYFISTPFVPQFRWNNQAFTDIFGFGIFTTGSALMIKITSQFDYLLVGKMLGKSSLGIYTFAFILTEALRSQMLNVFTKVMYPVFSKKQDDIESMRRYYFKLINISSLILIPLMFFFMFFTEEVILTLFGEKWAESIPIIKIFCICVMIHTTFIATTPMIRGVGKPKTEMYFQFIKALVFYLPLIFFGTYYFGIKGTAWGHLIAKILTMLLAFYYLSKIFKITINEIYGAISNSIYIGAIPFFTLFYFKNSLNISSLAIIYVLLTLLLYWVLAKKDLIFYKKILLKYFQKKGV